MRNPIASVFVSLWNRTGALSPDRKKRSAPGVRHKGLLGYSRVGLFGSGAAAGRHHPVEERSSIRRPRSPPPGAAHALERFEVEHGVREEREVNLPGHCGHTGFLHEWPTGMLPVGTPLALLRECKHVVAGITDGAEHPAVRGR